MRARIVGIGRRIIMKIVICAGGTGSIALQRGLYNLLDAQIDGVDTKILVNAFDNGLSTGSVRQVMEGKILGPSDVRKNQTTRLELENPVSPLLSFLNIRFTIESSKAEKYCLERVDAEIKLTSLQSDTLKDAIEVYFKLPLSTRIDYSDFSLANIVYAGLAHANNNSLRKAASIMANIMGIKDNVIINDDRSLFLGAITKSGRKVTDEGDIVSWGNSEDPFVDVFFVDSDGNETLPYLCDEARNALIEADMIILSSGTQWSSLIPTYKSVGFRETMNNCTGKILMIMNKIPDTDSPGQSASEIIELLVPRFFPNKSLHVLADVNGHLQMNELNEPSLNLVKSFCTYQMSVLNSEGNIASKHDPIKLAYAVGCAYFGNLLDSDYFMFDYDDTLVGRGNKLQKSSNINVKNILALNLLTKVGICTGNTVKSVNIKGHRALEAWERRDPDECNELNVFADGGVNLYSYNSQLAYEASDDGVSFTKKLCIDENSLLDDALIDTLKNNLVKAGIPPSKIDNRGNAIISIKPIDPEYRNLVLSLIRYVVRGTNLEVRPAGRTTIEICKARLSKIFAIKHVQATELTRCITYVGDELNAGNDADVQVLSETMQGIKCLRVSNPTQTAFFTTVLKKWIMSKSNG